MMMGDNDVNNQVRGVWKCNFLAKLPHPPPPPPYGQPDRKICIFFHGGKPFSPLNRDEEKTSFWRIGNFLFHANDSRGLHLPFPPLVGRFSLNQTQFIYFKNSKILLSCRFKMRFYQIHRILHFLNELKRNPSVTSPSFLVVVKEFRTEKSIFF